MATEGILALIGSPAPELRVSAWLRGEPIAGIETGQIYLVGFLSTQSGLTKHASPHLSKLAEQYRGQVTVIGVAVGDREITETAERLAEVRDFVDSIGDQASYPIAVAGADVPLVEAYMQTLGRNFIPACFVIDRSRRIAWAGQPVPELYEVLAKVVAGTYDLQASIKKRVEGQERLIARLQAFTALNKQFSAALERRDYDAAIELVEVLERETPSSTSYRLYRVQAGLACGHEREALVAMREIIDDPKSGQRLQALGWLLAEMANPPKEAIRMGIQGLEMLIEESYDDPRVCVSLYALAVLVAYSDRELALVLAERAFEEGKEAGEWGVNSLPKMEALVTRLRG